MSEIPVISYGIQKQKDQLQLALSQ